MDDPRLLGRIALASKLITRDQLVAALQQQAREGGRRRLGEILVERGDLTAERFEELLEAQRRHLEGAGQAPPSPAAALQPAVPAVAPEAPAADLLGALLRMAVSRRASDLHLHSGVAPRLRLAGRLTEVPFGPLDAAQCEAMVRSILDPEQSRLLDETGQVDFAASLDRLGDGLGRFRVNAYRQQRGLDAVLRVIPAEPPTLFELGLPSELARLVNFREGLVLVTGPAGCGKTSTLAALVRILNEERREHVLTIEDPVEYLHAPKRCVVNQRQVGRDTASFAQALRAALREDPDVIVLGEVRDLESVSLALTAAETGHLVLASMHTTHTVATLNRLIGMFPPDQQAQVRLMLSESLRGAVAQRLVPRADGTGRVPAVEVLLGSRAVSNLIREDKTFQIRSLLQTGASRGMCLLDGSLEALVRDGVVARDEARRAADDPARFKG